MLRSFALKRFAPYLPLAGLLLVGLASFVLYVRERSVAAYPVLLELENATQLKEQQVKRWFKEQKAQILEDAKADLLQRSAAVLLTTRIKSKPEYKAAYNALSQYFSDNQRSHRSAALLTNGGTIIFSTDSDREGEYQPLQNTTTYFEPKEVDRVVPNFYVAANTGKPSITFATPILTQEGKRLGALAIDLDLEALDRLIRSPIQVLETRENYLGQTGQTYLVGRISPIENAFLDFGTENSKTRNITSKGIELAMQGNRFKGLYLNYLKQPVAGSYAWLDQQNLVLVAEMDQVAIFESARSKTQKLFVTGVMATILISAIVLFFQDKKETELIAKNQDLPFRKKEDSDPPASLLLVDPAESDESLSRLNDLTDSKNNPEAIISAPVTQGNPDIYHV